ILYCCRLGRPTITANGPRIGEVAENRSGKFRFRRHVANAFLSVAKLQKKPMQKALAAYEDGTFNLPRTPPFCQCYVGDCSLSFRWVRLVNNRPECQVYSRCRYFFGWWKSV